MVAEIARTRQSVFEANACCSCAVVVVTIISSPCTFVLFVVTAADVVVDVVAALPFFELRVGTGAARARAGRQSNARRGVEIDHTVLLPVRYDDGQSICDPSADGDQHQL